MSRAKGVTSWWRTPSDILDGRTPLQELEDGDLTEVAVDNSDQRGQAGMVGEWGSCNGNPVRSSGTVINSVDSGCAAAAAQRRRVSIRSSRCTMWPVARARMRRRRPSILVGRSWRKGRYRRRCPAAVAVISFDAYISFRRCVMSAAHEQPTVVEQEQARQALQLLRDVDPAGETLDVTVAGTSESVHLPRAALDLIREVLANMAAGQGVTVVPAHAELTTQQAAQMLNVSRPHVIKLLDEGNIEYRMVGRHRRILASSLLAYQRTQLGTSRAAADELAALTEDLGLY